MDKKELRRRFEKLSVESSGAYSSYVRSTNDLWRALVRTYLWWHECQLMPDLLDELYEENGIQVKAKADNSPNFGPLLRIVFDRVELQHERERIIFWKWGCAVSALHVEHSENPQRYRNNAEGKLCQFFADAGGIDGLTKKEDGKLEEAESEHEALSSSKSRKKPAPAADNKIKKALQARAKAGLVGAKGIGTAATTLPVRVGEDGLIAVLARREPNGKITILGSSNTQSAIDHITEHLLSTDITHLPPNVRVLSEVIRSQAYPAISMPSDPAKRGAWYRSVLLDKSPIKTSDLAAAESGKKKEHLKAPTKLLIRGAHGDVILSGSKTGLSVVTSCKPAKPLIGKNDQVFLRVMERSVVERMLDTGEIHLLKASPQTGLKRSSADARYTYELMLDNGIGGKAQTLHFYDAKQKACMLTGFQAGFDFDAWKPDWTFRVQPVWFGKLREKMLDEWFSSFGAGKQPNRPSNLIMQAVVTAKSFGLVFNIHDENLAPHRKLDIDVKLKTTKRTHKTEHLSKDVAPVLFNLADVHSDGMIEVSGNEQALVFAYKNDLGTFKIAVPTAERKKKSAVRNSTAFSEVRYG
jgi:hypothetical protein